MTGWIPATGSVSYIQTYDYSVSPIVQIYVTTLPEYIIFNSTSCFFGNGFDSSISINLTGDIDNNVDFKLYTETGLKAAGNFLEGACTLSYSGEFVKYSIKAGGYTLYSGSASSLAQNKNLSITQKEIQRNPSDFRIEGNSGDGVTILNNSGISMCKIKVVSL